MKSAILLLLFASAVMADLVADVRADLARKDFAAAEARVAAYRTGNGADPLALLAYSWLGRSAQANKMWDKALTYAVETRKRCLDALKSRKIDDEPSLPLALGASIEVTGHATAGQGRLAEAVVFLKEEEKRWHATSMRARIQKNIHLLSLEGKPAPAIEMTRYLGAKPTPVAQLKGKPVVLFFWAHWCPDCKKQAAVLERLRRENEAAGLVVVGPTQTYGYVAGGEDAAPAREIPYIDEVRKQHYGSIQGMTVPLSGENFKAWGCSTTPTVALVDRKGIVTLYHPGAMTHEELAPHVARIAAR